MAPRRKTHAVASTRPGHSLVRHQSVKTWRPLRRHLVQCLTRLDPPQLRPTFVHGPCQDSSVCPWPWVTRTRARPTSATAMLITRASAAPCPPCPLPCLPDLHTRSHRSQHGPQTDTLTCVTGLWHPMHLTRHMSRHRRALPLALPTRLRQQTRQRPSLLLEPRPRRLLQTTAMASRPLPAQSSLFQPTRLLTICTLATST